MPNSPDNRRVKWLVIALAALGAALLATGLYLHFHHVQLEIQTRTIEPKLTEIDITNPSKSDQPLDEDITATWTTATLDSAGGLAGYDPTNASSNAVTFKPSPTTRPTDLHPQESRAIGWIRLTQDAQIQTHLGDQ
jgi:hypothetical protein